ncbi:MAG TPA: acetyl-CoA carboxylase biotin carboxyl carrier protein subunit, partial [Nocardioidaceae bacterium]|nr:acetyl-CoA carboxylase biotin carboxyl carrier protein subunit [Nocardioidaceae bacterium]
THLIEVDGVTHRVSRDEGGVLRSPAPALVVATPVAVGDVVAAGAPVLVLESMKMETVIHAPVAGRVRDLLVITGSQVETGQAMVRLEPVVDDSAAEAPAAVGGPAIELPQAAGSLSAQVRADRCRAELSALILGYDIPQGDRTVLQGYLEARAELRAAGVDVVADEAKLLELFTDFAELSRNSPADEERRTELRVHSSREHFHTFLLSLDTERGGLPDEFRRRIERVVAHYGVKDLERTPALEEAVFRVFLAQQHSSAEVEIVTTVLQRWIDEPAPSDSRAAEVRELLERLKGATQLRFPVIGDLARSVRFRWFDQPLVDAERTSVLAGVRDEVAALADDPDAPDRVDRIDALAAIPEQIVQFLAERIERGIEGDEPLLEVLVKRHYREFDLRELTTLQREGRPMVFAGYVLDERPTRLVSTVGTVEELSDPSSALVAAVTAELAARPEGNEATVDLYLHWPAAPESVAEAEAELHGILDGIGFAQDARRVTVAVCPGSGRSVDYFTFRPDDQGGLVEDDLVHGMHP